MTLFLYFVIVLSIFGPKLLGVIDLSLVGALAGVALLLGRKKVCVTGAYLVLVGLLVLMVLYSIAIWAISGAGDSYVVLRHFRALLSTALLGLVFYNLGCHKDIDSASLANVLLLVLLTNAVAILLGIVVPEFELRVGSLFGFNKGYVPLRSPGLTAGYDTAGYFCVFGVVLSATCVVFGSSFFYRIALITFAVAALFTSRSTMLFLFVVLLGVFGFFILRGKQSTRLFAVLMLAGTASVIVYFVIPVFTATFPLLKVFLQGIQLDNDFSGSYASTELGGWRETMWRIPSETGTVVFGNADDPAHSDLGYVKMVFMVGVLGLFLSMLVYLYMVIMAGVFLKGQQYRRDKGQSGERSLRWTLVFILASMFVINFKNLYFLTRGYHELIVVLFTYLAGWHYGMQQQSISGHRESQVPVHE